MEWPLASSDNDQRENLWSIIRRHVDENSSKDITIKKAVSSNVKIKIIEMLTKSFIKGVKKVIECQEGNNNVKWVEKLTKSMHTQNWWQFMLQFVYIIKHWKTRILYYI